MIVPGMFVCSSFLISVCMFIVSKAFLVSSATVIVRAGGAIWLNPVATVLFTCFRGVKSTSRKVNTGAIMFSFYIAGMPRPTERVNRVCYAYDITVWAT